MMLLMGMLRERKGREGQPRAGRKNRETEKTRAIRRRVPSGVSKMRALSIHHSSHTALGEQGARRVRARVSFLCDGRNATSVDMTHSCRSLIRNPAPRPHGAASIARGRGRKIFRDAGLFAGWNATDLRNHLGWTTEEIVRSRAWQTYKMSFTKNPTNPMTMNPIPVRVAILLNSLRSGLVHFLMRRYESLANSFTGLTAISATSMVSGALKRETRGARCGAGG